MRAPMQPLTATLSCLSLKKSSNLSPVVYVESLTGNQYLERKTEIARYREALEYLRDLALSLRDSM